jgi:hypothetical protein
MSLLDLSFLLIHSKSPDTYVFGDLYGFDVSVPGIVE